MRTEPEPRRDRSGHRENCPVVRRQAHQGIVKDEPDDAPVLLLDAFEAGAEADRTAVARQKCQRRVDALDPGSSPSARTESLYGELSRRVLVDATRPVGAPARYAPAVSD